MTSRYIKIKDQNMVGFFQADYTDITMLALHIEPDVDVEHISTFNDGNTFVTLGGNARDYEVVGRYSSNDSSIVNIIIKRL